METINIDPDGDVVLVCGEEGQQKRLRVHSVILSRASQVFKALLSPRFSEGTELSSRGSAEVALPDDDGEALEIICLVLHHRNEEKVFGISLDDLGTIAQLVDKYDLALALRPTAQAWMGDLGATFDARAVRKRLTAAYLFRHARLFERFAKDLMMTSHGSISPKAGDATGSIDILKEVIGALQDQKRSATTRIAACVEDRLKEESELKADPYVSCGMGCSYAEKRLFWILARLRKVDLWPVKGLENQPLETTLTALETSGVGEGDSLDGGEEMPSCDEASCGYQESVSFYQVDEIFIDAAGGIRADIKLPCYECVREGKVLDPECSHKKDAGS